MPSSRSSSGYSSSSRSSSGYTSYFVPGYGLSRHVVFTHIPYYLGPCASVRPFSYQQREGYLISNPGAPLTKVGHVPSILQGEHYAIENNVDSVTEPNRRPTIPLRTVRAAGGRKDDSCLGGYECNGFIHQPADTGAAAS